jgi:hypothetical protein
MVWVLLYSVTVTGTVTVTYLLSVSAAATAHRGLKRCFVVFVMRFSSIAARRLCHGHGHGMSSGVFKRPLFCNHSTRFGMMIKKVHNSCIEEYVTRM